MKKFLRSLIVLAACSTLVVACNKPDGPNPDDGGQKVNTWVFNDGKEVKVGSSIVSETSNYITVLFSAEKGLATAQDLYGADDCTEITFPSSAIGSEIDLAALTEEDGSTYIISKLPEFGKKNGFSINGYDKTISEGKLSTSLGNDGMTIKCEFTTLDTGLKFSAYLLCPFKRIEIPEPDGNYYEYDGKVVELKSVYAVSIEDGADTYFGFYSTPDEGVKLDDVATAPHRISFKVDGESMVQVLDSGKSIFNLQNLPAGCKLNLSLVNETDGLQLNIPDNSVYDGTIVLYFSEAEDSGYMLNVAGNIILNNGKVLKMSCVSKLLTGNPEEEKYGRIEYAVKSRNIAESNHFRSGFYYQNTWDDGMIFTYSISGAKGYIQLGSNAFVEIYAGSKELLNGKAFNVAETKLPFSFKIEYLDRELENTVPVTISNNNRSGASGHITFTKNSYGLYDAQFDVTLNNGDIIVKGNFAGEMKHRNKIYTDVKGDLDEVRSATLDISGDPRILYLSTKPGTAGPDQYDIKGEVEASEWRYGKFMAFGGQGSSITWIDGVCYNSKNKGPFLGGNWRVLSPTPLLDGKVVSECQVMLFGTESCFAYYYGELKVIK